MAFSEFYFKYSEGVDVVIRIMPGNRVDLVRNHELLERKYMREYEIDQLLEQYEKYFGHWYRAIGEDLPEVIWCGK